jgi:hypothetical protein
VFSLLYLILFAHRCYYGSDYTIIQDYCSFRRKEWKLFANYLNNNDRKAFNDMFSIARLYNSACSYAVISIRINPIMISIVFHHYKILKDNTLSTSSIEDTYSNHNSTILQKELDKWKTYTDILRKPNRSLFNQMLKSAYEYSDAIEAKGEEYATRSLLMSIMLEHYKKLMKDYLSDIFLLLFHSSSIFFIFVRIV